MEFRVVLVSPIVSLSLSLAVVRMGSAGSALEASLSLEEEDDMVQLLRRCQPRMKMSN